MTVEEALNVKVCGEYTCITVKSHKMGSKYPAVIPLVPNEYKAIKTYQKLRNSKNNNNYFFIRGTGNHFSHPGKEVNRLQKKYGYSEFNSSQARKAAETAVSYKYGENDPKILMVSDLLTQCFYCKI